ncbi:CDK5 regulatory subunit-associated protein 3 [Sesbania bispinosa]|nr:CDK5 regulatory subunit-associated protein 3 [Sesbania bispinosa]
MHISNLTHTQKERKGGMRPWRHAKPPGSLDFTYFLRSAVSGSAGEATAVADTVREGDFGDAREGEGFGSGKGKGVWFLRNMRGERE